MEEDLVGSCHKDTGASLKELLLAKSGQAKHQNIKYSNKV